MITSGIIIIDKPAGWTSHDVVAKLRGILKVKRIGHGGTLDPMATGVLPVFIGRATRAAEFCENSEKEYIAGLRLGITTDTQDITGNVLDVCEVSVCPGDLIAVVQSFLGAQKQTPPMYSAIKINGKKLYELARQGLDVPRQARDIVISDIELMDCLNGNHTLRIVCSKGTYIRTLCHDIGTALGCGGTMSSLRRTRAGVFTIDMSYQLDEIPDMVRNGSFESILMPVDSMFSAYPAVTLSGDDTRRCKNGAPCSSAALMDGTYRFYSPEGEFLMLGEAGSGEIKTIKSFFSV